MDWCHVQTERILNSPARLLARVDNESSLENYLRRMAPKNSVLLLKPFKLLNHKLCRC